MSRESKFHKLIEKQNAEEKEAFWKKLESRLESERDIDNIECDGEVLVMSKNRTNTTRRNLLIVVAVFMALALAICLTFFIVKPFNNGSAENDNKNEIENPEDKRFCTENDYRILVTDVTVKKYSAVNNLGLLYFDVYDEVDFYTTAEYRLNETQELVCLCEEFLSLDDTYVLLYITDDKTEIFDTKAINSVTNETEMNGVKVKYGKINEQYCASFDYKGNSYSLKVSDVPTDGNNYVLGLAETLLN